LSDGSGDLSCGNSSGGDDSLAFLVRVFVARVFVARGLVAALFAVLLLVVFATVFVAPVFVAELLVAFAGAFFVRVVDFVFLFMNEIFSKYISLSKKIFKLNYLGRSNCATLKKRWFTTICLI